MDTDVMKIIVKQTVKLQDYKSFLKIPHSKFLEILYKFDPDNEDAIKIHVCSFSPLSVKLKFVDKKVDWNHRYID